MKKSRIQDLAILGGEPAFSRKVHVGRPNIPNRQRLMERINAVLDRRWLTNMGPCVQELEQRIADLVGVKHCICMCNGTIALQLAIRAAGLTGEVIVPSFTFVATAHALQWQEITPVFCDVDPATHNIDPAQIERLITPRTSAIIGVHVWGRACDVEALSEIAHRHGLKLMFDAAHAFCCSHNGKMIGGFGDAEIFSFHATKFFNTFEGGAVVTNDDDLAGKIRLMQNFGFSGYDNVTYIGTNAKMTEICAAMGLASLDQIDAFVSINQANYEQYERAFGDVPGVRLMSYGESEKANYQYVVLEIDENVAEITRDELVKILHAENILVRRYFYPGCHKMEPYRSCYPNAGLLLPNTDSLVERVMSLPTGSGVEQEEIERICEIIRLSVAYGSEIREKLAGKPGGVPPARVQQEQKESVYD